MPKPYSGFETNDGKLFRTMQEAKDHEFYTALSAWLVTMRRQGKTSAEPHNTSDGAVANEAVPFELLIAERAAAELAAVENAAREAAETAERERLAAEAALKEANERAAQAERDRLASIKKAEDDARIAADLAEKNRLAAIEAERKRVADEAEKVRKETEAREADKKHRAKINNEALQAISATLSAREPAIESEGEAIVNAIARGQIPHVTISY